MDCGVVDVDDVHGELVDASGADVRDGDQAVRRASAVEAPGCAERAVAQAVQHRCLADSVDALWDVRVVTDDEVGAGGDELASYFDLKNSLG